MIVVGCDIFGGVGNLGEMGIVVGVEEVVDF